MKKRPKGKLKMLFHEIIRADKKITLYINELIEFLCLLLCTCVSFFSPVPLQKSFSFNRVMR